MRRSAGGLAAALALTLALACGDSTAPNQPPMATIGSPSAGSEVFEGAPVTFQGSATDPESGTLSGSALTWRSDLDGTLGTGSSLTVSTLSPGSHSITLTATDPAGGTGTAQVTIDVVENRPPTATIVAPADGAQFLAGEEVEFRGSASDPEDVSLGNASLVWSSDVDGELGTGTPLATSSLTVGSHMITFTATDSRGLDGTAQITVTVLANGIPEVSISEPADGANFTEGELITFTGSATDPEDGSLPGPALAWSSSIDGSIGSGGSVVTDALSAGDHVITLSAVDGQGQNGSATVSIQLAPRPGDAFEDDDSSGDATVTASGEIQTHNISPADDEDWITFTLAAPSVVVLETRTEPGDDTFVELYDGSLGLLEADNSRITRICGTDELPAGDYFARVTSNGGANSIAAYDLAYTSVTCADFDDATPGYDIEVRYLGTPPTASQQQTFEDAAARWAELIVGDIGEEVQLHPFPIRCSGVGPELAPIVDQIDDLVIFARVGAIDGAGGILGQAGPCSYREGSRHPFIGLMSFDEADVPTLEGMGQFEEVILHEMGHVIGFGSTYVWDGLGLLQDRTFASPAPINDTHFSGTNAIAAFDAVGGAAYPDAKVPLENDNTEYGGGSLNGHWREGVFDTELMSPRIDAGANPISQVTVESMRDLGYEVNPAAADPYTLFWTPLPPVVSGVTGEKLYLGDDILDVTPSVSDGDGGLRVPGDASAPGAGADW